MKVGLGEVAVCGHSQLRYPSPVLLILVRTIRNRLSLSATSCLGTPHGHRASLLCVVRPSWQQTHTISPQSILGETTEHNEEETLPEIWFPCNHRKFKLTRSSKANVGTVPLRAFESRDNPVSCVKALSWVGMDPFKEFWLRFNRVSLLSIPNVGGMGPSRAFSFRNKLWSCVNIPIV